MNTLLILLNRSLLDIVEKNQKPVFFFNLEIPSRFYI